MSHLLAEAVAELTRPHLRRSTTADGEEVYGQEEALLVILEETTGSNTGSGSVSGVSGNGTPLNIEAVTLFDEITKAITEQSPYGRHPALRKSPWTRKVQAWHNATTDPVEALRLYELLDGWREAIRELLEPTKKVPMRGMTCPECLNTHVERAGEDGVTYNAAITVYPQSIPVRADCAVCEAEWSGKELHILASRGVDTGSRNM